jgi:hypothetical protein
MESDAHEHRRGGQSCARSCSRPRSSGQLVDGMEMKTMLSIEHGSRRGRVKERDPAGVSPAAQPCNSPREPEVVNQIEISEGRVSVW